MKPAHVVAFDLDDTLVAEALFIKSGIRHIARRLHECLPSLEAHRITAVMDEAMMRRHNHYSALELLLGQKDMARLIDMKEVVAEFRGHVPDHDIYHLPPSIRALLSKLKDEGHHLALITDGRSLTQRNKIMAAGLNEFFPDEDILISEETGHDKLAPDNFMALMRRYPDAIAFHYVGDNPAKDFVQPSLLGWHSHQVRPFPLTVHQGIPR